MGEKCRGYQSVVSGTQIFSDVYLNKLEKKFCESNFCSTYLANIPTYARKIPTFVTVNGSNSAEC